MPPITLKVTSTKTKIYAWIVFLCVCVLINSSGCSTESPPERFTVKGQVFINEDFATYMVVRLHPEDESLLKENVEIATMTDGLGNFEFSEHTETGGVPVGIYKATFFWPLEVSNDSQDRLQGKFSMPEESQFTIIVNPESNKLQSLNLKIDEEELLPGEPSGK